MATAISRLSHDVSAIEQAAGDGQKYVLRGTHLRHVLLDSFSPTSESTHSTPLQRADEAKYVSHETLDHGSRVFKDSTGAFKDDMRIMSWAKRYIQPNPVRVEGDPYLPLNASQTRAVATMIAEGMSLIQGVRSPSTCFGDLGWTELTLSQPPGTGKTKTIIETVKLLKVNLVVVYCTTSSNAFSKKHFAVVHPIMVCTYTNVAVDNLVEGFATAGLDPIRIGYGQVKSTLQEHSFEFKIEQHPLYPKYGVVLENLKSLEKDLSQTYARIFEHQKQKAPPSELSRLTSRRDVLYAKLSRFNSTKQTMYQQMQTEVLASADVVRFFASHPIRIPCAYGNL